MMALAPKKFDRYLLPIFPTIEILAAVGFWLLLRRLPRGLGVKVAAGRAAGARALAGGPSAYVFPYYLAYYNPLLGGGAAARRAFVVGWGEGLDIVTDYLNKKPDAERLTVAGFYPRVMSAQFKGTVLSDKQYDAAMADYIVLYVNAVQRDLANRLRMVTRGKRSEMVVKINGIEYARLYACRRPRAGTRPAPSSGADPAGAGVPEVGRAAVPEVGRPQPRRHDRGDDPLGRSCGRSTRT